MPGGPAWTHDGVDPTAPPVVVASCDYSEADDATNDYDLATYALEETGIMISTATGSRTLCGSVNAGHFDTDYYSIDIDNYGITLAQDADIIVTLSAVGGGDLPFFGIYAYDPTLGEGVGGNEFYFDHGVFTSHLTAGSYEFSVEAYGDNDIAASIPYRMRVAIDHPASRCPQLFTTADYTEAHDGATSIDNNVVSIDYSAQSARSMSPWTTSAEATGVMMNTANYRIAGISGSTTQVGSYFDADTYSFTTGATTNQMAVRLNWGNASADLDYYILDGLTEVGASAQEKMGEDEFATFAVQPNTTYWLWVGGYEASQSLPASYSATMCGETFAP